MRALLGLCALAVTGFVAYQQWSYQSPQNVSSKNPLNWFRQEPPPPEPEKAILIHGHPYEVGKVQQMYDKIKNSYVMKSGECLHLWQCPSAPRITYDEFVVQLKNGYYFVELSEPGSGPKVVLKHNDMDRNTCKKDITVRRTSSCSR
jgi:hypothetical protein